MRFYLDNDVDHRCRRVLTDAGHDCWATSQAGKWFDTDDEQARYACDMGAVLITHDTGFAKGQRRSTTGRFIWLCCEHPDGPKMLARWLDDILAPLEHRPYVVIELRWDRYTVCGGDWE